MDVVIEPCGLPGGVQVTLMPFAIVSLIFYSVGFPGAVGYILYRNRDTIKMDDGKEYPLFKLDISSESHPFYTGAQQRVMETGRVEKFRQKFGSRRTATPSA